VVTSLEAGNANRAVPDEEVPAFAASADRILLTQNRRHFLRLHQMAPGAHAGVVVCTSDPDFHRRAWRIDELIRKEDAFSE